MRSAKLRCVSMLVCVAVAVCGCPEDTGTSTFAVETSTLGGATLSIYYTQQLSTVNGTPPCTWTLMGGALPPGLSLYAGGTVSGTPTLPGSYSFTVTATDSTGAVATGAVTLVVNEAPEITTNTVPDWTVGRPFDHPLNVAGGSAPHSWSVTSGALPTGLLVTGSSIGGTPTSLGSSTFTLRVQDTGGATDTHTYTQSINPPPQIQAATLPDGTTGLAYSSNLSAINGTPPFTWGIQSGALPTGLALSPSTGEISGTPTATGVCDFVAFTSDTAGATATRSFTISIPSVPPDITTTALPEWTVGETFDQALGVAGGSPPFTWSITSGSLSPGLDIAGGSVTGTPTSPGTYSFTLFLQDSFGATDSQPCTQTVNPQPQIIASTLPDGTVDQSYSTGLSATDGTLPLTWGIQSGSLPAGLTLSTSSGAITGTPTTEETQSFTVIATDAAGATDTHGFSIAVCDMPTNDENIFRTNVSSASSDTTPPVLTSLIITPSTAAGGDSVLISATATDDISGVAYLAARMSSPSSTYVTYTLLYYNETSAQHEGYLALSEYAEPGTWTTTSVTANDVAGNSIEFTSGALITAATLIVTNSLWDETPPVLQSLSFSPDSVQAGETTILAASVTDDVSGVAMVYAYVAPPSGTGQILTSLTYNTATGLYEGAVRVPADAESGTWGVHRIYLYDTAGLWDDVTTGAVLTGATLDVSGGAPGDTQPPSLDAFCISPATANEGDTITFHALASDDVSGVASIYVYFSNPSGTQTSAYLYYNAATGLWDGRTTLPVPAQPGNWAVTQVLLTDGAGNQTIVGAYELQSVTILNTASYPPASSQLAVDIDNPSPPPPGDTTPPTVTGVNIAPGTAAVGEMVRIYASATDDTQVSYVYAYLRNPSGDTSAGSANLKLNYATGFYEGNFTVSADDEDGTWAVDRLYAYDSAGNNSVAEAAALAAMPILDISTVTSNPSPDNMSFTVDNPSMPTPDTTPPDITGINIAPGSVTYGESLRVYAAATDTDSGVSYAVVYLRSPDANQYGGVAILYENFSTGFFEGNFTVLESHPIGLWSISCAYVYDNQGNSRSVPGQVLDALPPLDISSITTDVSPDNMTFTITGATPPSDTTPPVVNGISISPSPAAGGGSFRVFADVTDDDSGVASTYVYFRSPSGNVYALAAYLLPNPATGYWEGTVTVPQSAEDGVYGVSRIQASDNAGNVLALTGDQVTDLPALNITAATDPIVKTTSFTVANSQSTPPVTDTDPPVIGSLTVTPTSIDAGQSVWLAADVSDDDSGVNSVSVRLTSPTDAYNVTKALAHNPVTELYEGALEVPQLSEDGVWRVTRISLTDNASNSTTINETDPFLQTTPVEVVVANSQSPPPSTDSTAPTITSLTVAPASVDAGDGVWYAADVSDDDSGVDTVRVIVKSPTNASSFTTYLEYNPATQLYEGGNTIPAAIEDGVWRVTNIYISDAAGNSDSINEADPFLQSTPVEVTVSNTQTIPPPTDTTPPVITNICIAPTAADAGQKVWVMAEITDDDSGVSYVSVTIKSPTDAYSCTASLQHNPANGRYEGVATVPLVSEDGVWRITQIYMKDNANNADTIIEGDPFLP